MPKYVVVYRDSKGRRHIKEVHAGSSAEAKKEVRKSSVTVEGMGGKYRTVAKVEKAERVG